MERAVAPEDGQAFGVGLLIWVSAILVGYLVAQAIPKTHFPGIAGILASNALIGGLAAFGVSVAAYMIPWWVIFSLFALRGVLGIER